MFFKYVILAALVAATNAGYLGAPAVGYAAAPVAYAAPAAVATPAITSQHSNILRSFGNLGQVSTYSKTIDTPFSTVRKADIRYSNDALAYHAPYAAAAPYAYHAPYAAAAPYAYAGGYAAPAFAKYAAAPAAITTGHSLLGVAYSAAPAVAHMTYSNGLGFAYGW